MLVIMGTLAGCGIPFRGNPSSSQVKAAQYSYITYETLSPTVASETLGLWRLKKTRSLSPDEQVRMDKLAKIGQCLEIYREAHNLYIKTLQPFDFEVLRGALNQCIDLALELGLSFHAVRLP